MDPILPMLLLVVLPYPEVALKIRHCKEAYNLMVTLCTVFLRHTLYIYINTGLMPTAKSEKTGEEADDVKYT